MLAFFLAVKLLIMMALGVIAKKTKLVDNHTTVKLSSLILNIGIPCLIINSMNIKFDPEEFKSALVMIPLAVGVLLILFVVGLIYRRFVKDRMLGAACQFGIMFPNFTYIGVPVMETLYGASGLLLYTVFTAPVRIFFYSMPAFVLDVNHTGERGLKHTLKAFISPPLVALYIGLIIYLFQIPLPDFISDVLKSMTTFTSTAGMLVCGMLVADVDLKSILKRPTVLTFPLLANLVTPLIILAALMFLPVDPLAIKVAVTFTSLPVATFMPAWVAKYGGDHEVLETCSLHILLTTVLSAATLPLMVYLTELALR